MTFSRFDVSVLIFPRVLRRLARDASCGVADDRAQERRDDEEETNAGRARRENERVRRNTILRDFLEERID